MKCIDKKPEQQPLADTSFTLYAGSAACASCHKAIYDSQTHSSHYLTSQESDSSNVLGSFEIGKNQFFYNPNTYIAAEKRDNELFQVEYANGIEKTKAAIDITVGSGKRGQTFLHWDNDKLFQLPLSYFTSVGRWTNSPGYSNRITFRRPITSRCLECHGTYFDRTSAEHIEPESFSRTNIVYGVGCERCHGPGARHVAFQKANPAEKRGLYITGAQTFSRQQTLDMCRLCHGGRLTKARPSFSFQPGDDLSRFFVIDPAVKGPAGIDVHGNQYGLLTSSKCFINSNMTCITCHDPHQNEKGMLETFSRRCMNCHKEEHKKIGHLPMLSIKQNCIDCHMPELPSRSIMMLLQGQSVPTAASMRTHFITIYPDETKKTLTATKKK